MEQLGQNLNLKHIKVKDEEIAKLTRLDVLRDGLKCYVEDIHKTIMPIEMSLYEVYGAIAELQDLPFVRLTLDGIGDYSKDEVNRMGLLVENLEMTRGSLGEKWYKPMARNHDFTIRECAKRRIKRKDEHTPVDIESST